MRQSRYIVLGIYLMIGAAAIAQKDAKRVYEGNEYYNSGKIPESAQHYREALKENPHNAKAHFNLGNALYRSAQEIRNSKENFIQGKKKVTPDSLAMMIFEEAAQSFAQVANSVSDKDTLHRAWHNIGNCYLQKKDYSQAVEAYKRALKLDPKDEETRYNLAYALKNMPKQQGGGGQNNQNQNQNQNEKKQQQQQKPEMSKDQAEQLLQALMQAEKKLQDKRRQKQQDAGRTNADKDW